MSAEHGPVKTWLVSGFLGAGKTTFIREQLKSAGARVAVLVNEFGELGIDDELIRSAGGIDVVELPGDDGALSGACRPPAQPDRPRVGAGKAPDLFQRGRRGRGDAMNQKERLTATLAGKPVDRPPFICPGGMMTMVVTEMMERTGCFWPEAHTDPERMARLTLAASELAGIENAGVPFCMTIEAEGMGAEVGLGSRESEPRVNRYVMAEMTELDRLAQFDPSAGRARVCAEAIRLLKKSAPHLPVIANLSGPVSLATSVIDPLLYYRALRRDRGAAHFLTRHCTDVLAAFGTALIDAGADVVCIADPSATGEIIGREAFAEFAVPYLNELTNHFREQCGVPTIVHICGNVKSIGSALSALSAASVSVDSMVGIGTLRELAPGKATMGNVSTFMLEKGEPAQLLTAARRCLAEGVDILAPACGISPRTPVANIRAVAAAVAGDLSRRSAGALP